MLPHWAIWYRHRSTNNLVLSFVISKHNMVKLSTIDCLNITWSWVCNKTILEYEEWTNLDFEFGFGDIGAFGPNLIERISRSSRVPPHCPNNKQKHPTKHQNKSKPLSQLAQANPKELNPPNKYQRIHIRFHIKKKKRNPNQLLPWRIFVRLFFWRKQ